MLRASAGSIKFASVYDAVTPKQRSSSVPFSHFLEIDGVRILLDCGWDDRFDVQYLEKLMDFVPTADVILLSTPEIQSCGALPFVLEHLKEGAFVAAAPSTTKMALHGVLHPFLYQFANTASFTLSDGTVFTLTVDKIYSAFRQVREPYGGRVIAANKDVEVECGTVFTGRMLGGYGWLIKYQIDELFYCPDFSLKPSSALKRFVVPTTSNLVVLQSFPMHLSLASTSKKYEEQLQSLFRDIQHTLRTGSDVLVPVDVAGRGLEVTHIIARLLKERGGDQYKVILASAQAQELMDKAATMTEALQDDIILGEQSLFSNVVACRTAQEVMSVAGPKVCIADGPTLDYGISAELLPQFLPTNPQGGENLIVFPEPPAAGTNAAAVFESAHHEPLVYDIVRRSRLSKEELEEYYVQLEREMEERRQQLEAEGPFYVEPDQDNHPSSSSEDDDDVGEGEGGEEGEEENGAAGAVGGLSRRSGGVSQLRKAATGAGAGAASPAQEEAARPVNTPGLVLPANMAFTSKFLHFPVLDTQYTLNAAAMRDENIAYGLPVSDEEQMVLQKRAPARNFSDEGPENIEVRNDAQREANVPSKVFTESHTTDRDCKVLVSDLSGCADALTLKSLLKSRLTFAKKLVGVRGSVEDFRLLSQFCRSEKSLKCGDSVFMPQAAGIPMELATPVLSYHVQLDSELAHSLPRALRRVRETSSGDAWEVGWVNGELRYPYQSSGETEPQRTRLEEMRGPLALAALSGTKVQACAEQREEAGLQRGSFFVGTVDLSRLKEHTRKDAGLLSEFHKKAPMLVFDQGVCVRKGGNGVVTVASIASPAMFDVRKAVYSQFSQTL